MTIEKLNIDDLGIDSLGVSLTINVMKLDKSRFIAKQNGAKECDLTLFLSPNTPDKFCQHGRIQIALSKDDRDAGKDKTYVGNAKVFWAKKAESTELTSHKQDWDKKNVGYFGENEKKQEPKKEQQGFDDLEDIPF